MFFPELRAMVLKSGGVAVRVRRALAGAGGEVTVAVLFGSAPGLVEGGELDLLVVTSDLSRAPLERALAPVGRPVRLILLRPERFRALREAEDPELARVLARERLVIAGSLEHDP
jgi:hypothetical protein